MAEEESSGSSSGSDSEFEESREKLSEEEVEEERNVRKQGISDYEKQRLSRIAENKARMEALGLHKMASSLMGSSQNSSQPRKSVQRKGKSKVVNDDDDYKPNDDDDADDQDDDEDFVDHSSSKSRRNKVKNKASKSNRKVPIQKLVSCAAYFDDDELMLAITLSLQDSVKDATIKERKENSKFQEDAGRKKRKKSLSNRVQMTEDELVLHFFQFDEGGRGFITVGDLRRLAIAHDFDWTDKELADMIHLFDSDGDGKLNLEDFRKIAGRCNMIRESENSL